jgi:DNA-binding Lrp family transcriptional regulator
MDALIKVLRQDATLSPAALAAMLCRSESEIRAEISRLEAQGILLGYRAVVNEEKLGHDVVRAMIEVKITPERGGGFDKLAERISRYEEVRSCHLMSGGYDLLVEVEGADLRDVAAFVSVHHPGGSLDGDPLRAPRLQGARFAHEARRGGRAAPGRPLS